MRPVEFIPYEELELTRLPTQGGGAFQLKTPWFQLPIEIACDKPEDADVIYHALTSGEAPDLEAAIKVSWLLKEMASYPISYRAPRQLLDACPETWFPSGKSAEHLDPKQMAQIILAETDSWIPVRAQFRDTILASMRNTWDWEKDSVVDFSYAPMSRLHDVLSIFTTVRRFHLHHLAQADSSFELYRTIEDCGKQHQDRARRLICLTLRQNHFITENCLEALTPAMERDPQLAVMLREFIDSEKGHDKLLRQAIDSTGSVIAFDEIPVLASTEFAVRILRYVARTDLVGFACALDMFERDDYQVEDYLGSVLTRIGYEKSGKLLQTHKSINTQAEHDEMGIALLQGRPMGIPHQHLISTLRSTELLSHTMNRIASDILRHS